MYDADCGPCTRFKRSIDLLDAHNRLDFMSLVEADDTGFLDSIPANLRHRSFHLISPTGSAYSAAKALPELVRLLPSGRLFYELMVRAPGGLRAVDFVYSVASRLHDSGSCGYKPGQGRTEAQILGSRRLFGFLP